MTLKHYLACKSCWRNYILTKLKNKKKLLRSKDQMKVWRNSAQTAKQVPRKSVLLQDVQAHLIPSLLLPWCSSGNSFYSTSLHHLYFGSLSPLSSGYWIWSRHLCTQVIIIRPVPLSYISRSHSFYFKVWLLVLFWIPRFHFLPFQYFEYIKYSMKLVIYLRICL